MQCVCVVGKFPRQFVVLSFCSEHTDEGESVLLCLFMDFTSLFFGVFKFAHVWCHVRPRVCVQERVYDGGREGKNVCWSTVRSC